MTNNNHPITPPDELIAKWIKAHERRQDYCSTLEYTATQAARWGYEQRGAVNEAELQKARDEELDACCEWFEGWVGNDSYSAPLRAARRPNPEKSAEVALNLLDDVSGSLDAAHENGIRRALERLRELEDSNPKLPTPVVNEPPTELVLEGTRYTRADLVSPEDKDWGKHVVIGGVEYFPL